MRLWIIIILIGLCTGLKAQKETGNASIKRIMMRIPDSLTLSTNGMAKYINSKFTTQREKSRAIFIWITKNIKYNFDSIFSNSYYETPSAASERILKTRVGVCLQYADLFREVATKTGIRSYVIQGYTRQQGVVDYIPHLWSAALIDSAWCLIDPTWGSGYVVNGRFVNQVNNYYFMTRPEDLIKSHMPFDPLWQFLNYPVTNQEFYENDFRIDKNKSYFNFRDTLDTYEHESELQQYISSAGRIERNGVRNTFIAAKLRVLNGKIAYIRNQTTAEKYNTAVNIYNDGINKLNRFISYRNYQFEAEWDSIQLTQVLDSTEYLFTAALDKLKEIKDPDESLVSTIDFLNNAINGSMIVLNEQRISLYGYLKTWRK